MTIKEFKGKKCHWIYIDGVDESLPEYFKKNFKFHHLDIEDVISKRQRPKVDVYKYYLFMIFVFPYYDKERQKMRGREVDIFVNQDTLITISKKHHPFLQEIFEKISRSAKLRSLWADKGPSFLLYKILDRLFRQSQEPMDLVGHRIAKVEDDVYDNELKSVARDLALLRRSVLALRRMLDPQRLTVNTLVGLRCDFISEEMGHYFDDLHDYIEKIWAEAENYRETIDGLHWTNESLITQHTNHIITILTVLSASLMPLSLLAGFYGMNLSRLPLAHQPVLVYIIFATVAVLTVFLVTLITRSRKF